MSLVNTSLISILISISTLCASGQNSSALQSASEIAVYKTVGDVELKAWIFNPPKHTAEDQRSAIVFFFGGGWRSGNPAQFTKHCEYLAARGMVAMTVDYRVSSRHNVKAKTCVADAKSAIRWMRKNAEKLGIDPNRIVAGGGSAGGHLAASTALLPDHDDPEDDLSINAKPNALALFNPALVLADIPGKLELPSERKQSLTTRMGAPLTSMSPYHHIKKGIGPTIIFHGTDDTTVPFETAELFDTVMDDQGNDCTLVAYEGEGHGFFNYLKKNNSPFIDTVNKLDAFLVEIGYLEAPPTSKVY